MKDTLDDVAYTSMLSFPIVVSHPSFNFLCLLLLYSIYLSGPYTVKKIDGIPGLFLIESSWDCVKYFQRQESYCKFGYILYSFFPFYGYEMCPSYGQEIFCTVSERLNSLYS